MVPKKIGDFSEYREVSDKTGVSEGLPEPPRELLGTPSITDLKARYSLLRMDPY